MADRVRRIHPDAKIELVPRSSRGDRLTGVPLSALDGTDFFTEEIFEALRAGEADIAVHSLKDMSAPHFFSHDAFAVVDREDVRDIAIFHPSVHEKLRRGERITIGTCSPRRERMATEFLRQALPSDGRPVHIDVRSIRGNVEGRLQQLHDGVFDGTILATAGLIRLLRSDNGLISGLLADKPRMVLPLVECIPAPCQGAIVAEADPARPEMKRLLQAINDEGLLADAVAEKRMAWGYGTGCLQKFGVVTLRNVHGVCQYAAGEDQHGQAFSHWSGLPAAPSPDDVWFSSTDHMRSFFSYAATNESLQTTAPVVFIANYKALNEPGVRGMLDGRRVWVSGTRTWLELSRMGIWVEGSADALGIAQLEPLWASPLIGIRRDDVCMVTHAEAAVRRRARGEQAVAPYRLEPLLDAPVAEALTNATHIFWSSFAQFEHYGRFVGPEATHACPGGETAERLLEAGIRPVIFPTLKSFIAWKQMHHI